MKKLILLFIIIILSGCSSSNASIRAEENYFNAYKDINDEEIIYSEFEADFKYNFSDSHVMNNISDYIVLAKVASIDGGSNFNESTSEYVATYTYGKLEIIETLKGSIEDTNITYIRNGGIITINQYIAGMFPAQKEKFIANLNGRTAGYVKEKFIDDIDIEVGKTYLIYLKDNNMVKEDSYSIIGLAGGLREINQASTMSSHSDIQVFNNFTKEWENLSNIVE